MRNSFFKHSPDETTSVERLTNLEWEREPSSGWKLGSTYHFYGQLVYHFNQGSYFKKIVIVTNKSEDKFNINFQKPKNPLQFEALFEPFGFEYNFLQKEIQNYEIEAINLNRLIEVLDLLHKQKYISQAILHDIKLAITPNNPDLIKLKQAKEMDAKKPTMLFENKQFSLDMNLHAFVSNEDNKLYPRSAKEFTDYAIPTIENLLRAKANPNSTSNYRTPLISLVINQYCNDHTKQIANLLLQYGAELSARDWNMRTVLHHAALNQNKLWIEYLLEKGADATLTDDQGCTPKQTYLNSCKSNELAVDPEIETMLEKTEPVKAQQFL